MIRTVGNYQLLEQLGEGGMGAVYRAIDTQLDREVALKALRPELARRPDIVERFREEARIQGRLESAHIVRLYQFLRERDEYFMVMEFVRGTTLSRMLSERGRLAIDSAISIMLQALDGLDYAHGRNVVHRDIKPANIIINQQGMVKVTDFGIARLLGSARMTRVGAVIGTLEYISPEAAQGKDATALSDIYSCGVVLYEMLTGRLPFSSQNEYELVKMQIESSPPALRGWIPDIPRALENAVLRALAKKPNDRYASAAEMSRALSACAQMPATGSAGPETFWSKLRSLATSGTSGITSRPSFGNLSPPPPSPAPGISDFEIERRSAISSLSRRVDELLGQGKWEQAQGEVNRSSAQYPGDPAILEVYNRVVREQRHYAEGLQLALQEGRSLLERGLTELARTAVESSLRRYPNSTELRDLLRQVEEQITALAAGSSQVKVIAGRVEELWQQERFQEAINLIIEAVAHLPNRPELTALLSRTVQAQREHEKLRAVDVCREQVSSLRQSADWTGAFEAIDTLLSQYPGEMPLLGLRAEVERERDDQLRAAEVESSLDSARELEASGQLEAAERVLDEALRRFPDESPLAGALASVRAAREAARRRAIADAAIPQAFELKGKHEWETALDVLNAALRDAPGEERLEQERSETEQARDRYRAEVRSVVENGQALMKARRFEDALMTLSDGSQRFPKEREVAELLREAQQRLSAARREQQLRHILTKTADLLSASAFGEAEELLLNAISQFPDDPRLTRSLSSAIQGRREQEKRLAVAECIERTNKLAEEGCLGEAIRELDAALALYPSEVGLTTRREELSVLLKEERRVALLAQLRPQVESDLKAGSFAAPLSAVSAALREYPDDPDLQLLEVAIQEGRRTFDRERAETDLAQKAAELESRKEFAEAILLVKSALDYYPESERLGELRDLLQEHWQHALREQKAAAAESAAKRLLDAGDIHAAAGEVQRALTEIPGWPSLLALEAVVTTALRQAEAQEASRRVEGAIAESAWAAAETAVQDYERRSGDGELCNALRKKAADARRVRQKALGKVLARASSLVKDGEFASAIEALEHLSLNPDEREPFAILLEQARSGLRDQRLNRSLQELQDRVASALERGDITAALASLDDTRGELGVSPSWQEIEGRVLREEGIARAQQNALRHLEARAWAEALGEIESAVREFGDDPRLANLAGQILQEQDNHRHMVETALTEARNLSDAGDHEGAVQRLVRAVEAIPGDPVLEERLSEAQSSRAASERAERLQGVEAATRILLSSNEAAQAEALVEKALREMPGERLLFNLLRDARAAQRRKKAIDETGSLVEAAIDQHRWAPAESAVEEFECRYGADEFSAALRGRIVEAQQARQQALYRLLAEVSALNEGGDFTGAIGVLEQTNLDSRERPPFERLLEEARTGLQRQRTERGLDELRRGVSGALEEGNIDAAMALLAGVRTGLGSHGVWQDLEHQVRRERDIVFALQKASECLKAHAWDTGLRGLEATTSEVGEDPRLAELASRIQQQCDRRREVVEAVLAEVRSLLDSADAEQALERLTRAVEEMPDEPLLLEGIAEARRRLPIEQRAARMRSVNATVRSLLSSGQPEQAEAFIEESLRDLPGESSILALLKEARSAQRRKKALGDTAHAVEEAVSSHRWAAAESAVRSFERRYGSDSRCAGLRESTAKARTARQEALNATLVEASSLMQQRNFVGAIDVLQSPNPGPPERELSILLKQAQAGLKRQRVDQALQELRNCVSSAIGAGEVATARAALDSARQEFGRSAAWRELDGQVSREEGISEGINRATARAAVRNWVDALGDIEACRRQFGDDMRLTKLAERISGEQETHRAAVETALAEARGLAESGEHEAAVERLTRAAEQTGGDPLLAGALAEARLRLALYQRDAKLRSVESAVRPLLSSGHFERAERFLTEALRDLPGNTTILSLLDEAGGGRRRNELIEQYMGTARAHLDAKELARAESVVLESLRRYPDAAPLLALRGIVEEARLRDWREKGVEAALSLSRQNLAENRFEEARSLLVGARQDYGEDARLDQLVPEIEAAEQRRSEIDKAVTEVTEHLKAGRYLSALQLLEVLPEWGRRDETIRGLSVECRRMAAQQTEELERVTGRAEGLLQKGLCGDALALLEGASRDQHLKERLQPLLKRARELRAAAEQAAGIRLAAAATGPDAAPGPPGQPAFSESDGRADDAPSLRPEEGAGNMQTDGGSPTVAGTAPDDTVCLVPEINEGKATWLNPEQASPTQSGVSERLGPKIIWNLDQSPETGYSKLSEQIAALADHAPDSALLTPGRLAPPPGRYVDHGPEAGGGMADGFARRWSGVVRDLGASGNEKLASWVRRWWPR